MAQNPPPAIDPIADAELIPEHQFIQLTPNNYHLDVTQPAIQYQFWRSLYALDTGGGFQLEGRIDHTPVLLNHDLFRQFLHMPTAGSVQGRNNFDPILSDATLCANILSLGYGADLRLPSGFTRKYLSTICYTMFTYHNRCLSAITRGIDQTSTPINSDKRTILPRRVTKHKVRPTNRVTS
ncbi:hypothetical protein L6452_05971 [Arctium lappa]|uniref:Uncharacterized protein n=1 Tax=Arctium lappa TaxID=4217 RepID=A0ACB9EI58_ARCLA|nr:hypothetical protein L6452_05971 [Arctium lappa]